MDVIEPVYSLIFTKLVPTFHIHLQVLLGALVLWVLFKKSEKESRQQISNKPKNEMDIINDWQPEPLVPPVSRNHRGINPPVSSNQVGKHIAINGIKCLNFATHNYLGLVNNAEIEDRAVAAIQKYGVGSCGPRGFFGTVDVHLSLEERLAQFMGTEAAVLYSYGFSTIASAIPAYAKRSDTVFVDEAVNFSIHQGLVASRSHVHYFRHNDVAHLEELLEQQVALDKKNPKKAAKSRKFLIVEGIYYKTGEICPFPELVDLKNRYKLRLFVDESVSFGILGSTGRGITEYFNIPVDEVDLIMSSMEGSLASIGGFCVGTSFVVEHQVLSGLGYCFSASLPPLLAVAATTALNLIDGNPQLINELNRNSALVHEFLLKSPLLGKYFEISGFEFGPIKHLFPIDERNQNENKLQAIVDLCIRNHLALTVPAFHPEDINCHRPSLRLIVNVCHQDEDLNQMMRTLEKSVTEVFENDTNTM